MSNEIQAHYNTGSTLYALIYNSVGQVRSGTGFLAYSTAGYASYPVTMAELGTASRYYTGNMPAVVPGVYGVVVKQQIAGSAAESDPEVADGNIEWDGTAVVPRSNVVLSGQLGQYLPMRLTRGVQVTNFPIYFKSSADHITPFTSGIYSGGISRDGGGFGVLQSGTFTEIGQGFAVVQALTSGDLNANVVCLRFSAVGISGGAADPVPMAFILQRSSGQTII